MGQWGLEHYHFSMGMLSFIVCFITGFIPSIGTEVFLIIQSFKIHAWSIFFVVCVCSTLGQMLAKVIIYFLGYGAYRYLPKKLKRRWEKARLKYADKRMLSYITIFISALIGFPPFYLVNVLCGTLRTGFFTFLTMGVLGTFIRFFLTLLLPSVFIYWHHLIHASLSSI